MPNYVVHSKTNKDKEKEKEKEKGNSLEYNTYFDFES